MSYPLHGSNPHYLYAYYGLSLPDKVIDFSVNLNPLGMPTEIKQVWPELIDEISDYPDPNYPILKEKLLATYGLTAENYVIGNGASELIQVLASNFREKDVLLIQPTFSEYERACKQNDCQVSYHVCLDQLDFKQLDFDIKQDSLVFFCNPNNPTGIYYDKKEVKQLLRICEEKNAHLIMDEAFFDFVSHADSLHELVAETNHLTILRSMTKMYAIAGIRLGYVITNHKLAQTLKRALPAWNVSSVAEKLGSVSLDAHRFLEETQAFIQSEFSRLKSELIQMGYELSNSSVNFYLLRDRRLTDHDSLQRFLLERGMVTRHTYNFLGIQGNALRIAIKQTDENNLLLEALKAWRKHN